MDLTEKCLESREIYKGRILRLRVDTVALPNGKTSLREIVEHPGGVAIVALNDRGEVYVERQYRHPFGKVIMEIPAGKLEFCADIGASQGAHQIVNRISRHAPVDDAVRPGTLTPTVRQVWILRNARIRTGSQFWDEFADLLQSSRH